MTKLRLVLLGLCFALAVMGQPVVRSAANAASYLHNSLPNGGLARGGMGVAIGSNLGPASLAIATSFPLQTSMAGTSVRITVGGTQIDCLMVYTLAGQVAFIVPSSAPEGAGMLTVTFNNQTSAAFPVRIVRNAFGVFALNQAGSGPGIFTDPSNVVNTLFASAKANDTWIIWGTGLAPVTGNEAGGPLPGDMTGVNVTVLVGGQSARVVYRGRSGCCAGLDQIAFEIPAGVTGCYVPVVVVVEGVPSNFVTMSISGEGGVCSDRDGLFTNKLVAAQGAGLSYGVLSLRSNNVQTAAGIIDTETATGTFQRYDSAGLIAATAPTWFSTMGTCTVSSLTQEGIAADPVVPQILNAGGALNLNGPNGARTMNRTAGGTYNATLNTSGAYLTPGSHTITGAGGPEVGAFTASITVPPRLVWTNRDALTSIMTPPTLRWSGGDPNGFTVIAGGSVAEGGAPGVSFVCVERTSAGEFTIPAEVFASLPPSGVVQGTPTGNLVLSGAGPAGTFTATGVDIGVTSSSFGTGRLVAFKREIQTGGGGGAGLTVTSPTITEGGAIPVTHTCFVGAPAQPQSPGLTWTAGPANTQSYALIMLDPDAGNFVHWIVYDIPANLRTIPAGGVPAGARVGRNEAGQTTYFPVCPPPGQSHRYTFRVVALNVPTLNILPAQATRQAIEAAMTGRIVAEGTLAARFVR